MRGGVPENFLRGRAPMDLCLPSGQKLAFWPLTVSANFDAKFESKSQEGQISGSVHPIGLVYGSFERAARALLQSFFSNAPHDRPGLE